MLTTVAIASNGKVTGKMVLPEGETSTFNIASISERIGDELVVRGEFKVFGDMLVRATLVVGSEKLRDDGDERIGVVDLSFEQTHCLVKGAWVEVSDVVTTFATDADAPLVQGVWDRKDMPKLPVVNGVSKGVPFQDDDNESYDCTLKFGKSGKVTATLYYEGSPRAISTGSSTLSILGYDGSKWICELCVTLTIKKGDDGMAAVFDVEISDDGSVTCDYYSKPSPYQAP